MVLERSCREHVLNAPVDVSGEAQRDGEGHSVADELILVQQTLPRSERQKHSVALSGTRWHSVALGGTRWHSVALRGTQRHSEVFRGIQWHSHRRRSESAHLQQLVGRVVRRPHGLESFDTIQERVWEGSEPAILGARLTFSERLDDRGH